MCAEVGAQAIRSVDVRAGVGAIRGDVRDVMFLYRVPVFVVERTDVV